VPNFVIRQFRVPLFLLPIYQAAGNQYGIRWEILAAINEIESDYGRNLSVSTAGAVGWMQFLPSTWAKYGVDANGDGKRDPYNPVDAIFAAASYLKAAGGDKDIKKAIFAYNHAGWYVDSVLLRAKLIAGVPGDLIGSLTGLTEGRFPVAAHATYADDPAQHPKQAGSKIGIYSHSRAPVVAVTDGVVKQLGSDRSRGRYLVLQDAYGNRFSYTGLGSVAHMYPVPKVNLLRFPVVAAHAGAGSAPSTSASAGRQQAPAPAGREDPRREHGGDGRSSLEPGGNRRHGEPRVLSQERHEPCHVGLLPQGHIAVKQGRYIWARAGILGIGVFTSDVALPQSAPGSLQGGIDGGNGEVEPFGHFDCWPRQHLAQEQNGPLRWR
jgi:hypothetical protein